MREIKFRVWDTYCERMDYPTKKTGLVIGLDGRILSPILTADEKPTGSLYDYKDDFILMQYTGLKDKNGKEIYEGDIVIFRPYAGATDEYIGEVKWMNILSAFRVIKKTTPKFNNAPETVWKIIGNIYQDKELLNDNKRTKTN